MTIININGETEDTALWTINRGYFTGFPKICNAVGIVANQVQANKDAVDVAKSAVDAALGSISDASLDNTSTSSVAIGTGAKSFVVASSKPYAIGRWVQVFNTAAAGNLMIGQVTSWNAGTLTLGLNIVLSEGTGTFTAWTIQATGKPGSANISFSSLTEVDPDPEDFIILGDASDADAPKKTKLSDLLIMQSIFGGL
jgi:hypothetical protein